ncbi:MAG: thioredoxin domain-containing protein [Phycisphaerales bacterium]
MSATTDPHSVSRQPNRLGTAQSPYLLQHAHNPVEWWPWGEEAFAEARRRDVPIFLSIGYSTCYWCHVMERESFEDEATARVMNARFVNVKVDREERPDVDELYMAAVQTLTGHGGWPMSVFLEPQTLKPFWGGTYFPPEERHGLPAFSRTLEGMSEAWKTRREDVLKQAGAIASAVEERVAQHAPAALIGRPQVSMAVQTLLTTLDRAHGGFSDQPKFPQPVYLELLLDIRERTTDRTALGSIDHALRLTLDKMALGGMFDQIGGGFHRYSVDRAWIVPHFEKMLYDQGQLLSVYARAAAVYQDKFYARIAGMIGGYVMREMTATSGAFFTAQDAEVNGREGVNYLWLPEQVDAVLGGAESAFARDIYGLDAGPNFQDPHHPDEPARSILHLSERPEKSATKRGMPLEAHLERLDRVNARLLAARGHRVQPRLDDKIVTGWNGLMITGLARAARYLGLDWMAAAAAQAAEALVPVPGAALPRSTRGGTGTSAAVLEDYGAMILGLAELAETLERHPVKGHDSSRAIEWARRLHEEARQRFGDGKGGVCDTHAGARDLFARPRATYDGAMPSGTSLYAMALLRLAQVARDAGPLRESAAVVASISAAIEQSPLATANSTRVLLALVEADERILMDALHAAGAAEMPGGKVREGARGVGSGGAAVEVYASEETIMVSPEQPAELMVRVRIAPGHHLIAGLAPEEKGGAASGSEPLRIGIVGGGGIAAYADYPESEPWSVDPAVRVYTGEIEMRVAVEQTGDVMGSPRLAMAYQACTDRECLAPAVVELEVEILTA